MGIILIRINSVFHRNLDCVPPNGDFLSINCLDLTAPPPPLFVAWFLAGWTCHTATTIPRVLFTDVHIEEDTIGMVGGGGVGCIFFLSSITFPSPLDRPSRVRFSAAGPI